MDNFKQLSVNVIGYSSTRAAPKQVKFPILHKDATFPDCVRGVEQQKIADQVDKVANYFQTIVKQEQSLPET